jgi:hypothetical protein
VVAAVPESESKAGAEGNGVEVSRESNLFFL